MATRGAARTGDGPPAIPDGGGLTATAVSAGSAHTCALRTGGMVACWGANDQGQLGDGTTTRRTTPVGVDGVADAVAVTADWSRTCVAREGGGVACWGGNDWRETLLMVGWLSDFVDVPTPVGRAGWRGRAPLTDAVSVAASWRHACVVRAGGTVICWGGNASGKLGDGTDTWWPRGAVAVDGLGDAATVAAGGFHTCAVRANTTVVCWGANDEGQLGDATTTDRYRPLGVAAP